MQQEEKIKIILWPSQDGMKRKASILNNNFNRTIESNIIFICGNSYLVAEGPVLFEDDIKGCLIDEETA